MARNEIASATKRKVDTDKADDEKRKYRNQRERAEADFKKTGKKSETYKSIERKGFIKTSPSPAPSTSKSARNPTPGVDWSTSPLSKLGGASKAMKPDPSKKTSPTDWSTSIAGKVGKSIGDEFNRGAKSASDTQKKIADKKNKKDLAKGDS